MIDNAPNPTMTVVIGLSKIIAGELEALSGEYWSPRFAPDQSDSELSFRKERITRLRVLRSEFENVMFGLSPEVV